MPSHPLSRLDTAGQEYVSVCCRDFHSRLQQHAPHLLEEAIQKAPGDSRFALLCELLPIEIEYVKLRTGRLPSLHELSHAHPKLKEYLPKAYTWIPTELRLPDMLGRYKVLKVLGEGGQGCVVQARDELDDRLVAIKYAAHPAHVSLLRREQMFLSQLAHKNIIEVLGAGDEPGIFYVVLPLRSGESLQLVYAQHRPDPVLAAEITLQIARAIAHMHAKNVVHRDIKPGNIHLDPESPIETAVLLDLGMAVDVGAWNAEDRRILEHGGTKAYMAPEQLASDESSDPKLSDVFALGAVLYFLLVGEPPLDRAAAPEVLRKAKAPARLKRICRQAMETRPSLRQPSAAKFAGEIEHFLANRSTHRALSRLAIPLLPAVVVGFAALVWAGMKESPPPINPLAGEELWVERTAREMGINLEDISADDFEVTIELIEYTAGSNSPLPGAKSNVRIAVNADYPLDELLAEVEYRIGNCPWRNLVEGRMDGRSCNQLERREIEADGPVELRLDSMRDNGTGKIWGPYRYDISIRKCLSAQQSGLQSQTAIEWANPNKEWITETHGSWQIASPEVLDPSIITGMRCGVTKEDLSLALTLQGESYAFSQTFTDETRVFGESDVLYVQLIFKGGNVSDTQAFYAKHRQGYGGTIEGAKRFLTNPARKETLARFSGGLLRLGSLLVPAKEISMLEIGRDAKSVNRLVKVDWQPVSQTERNPSAYYKEGSRILHTIPMHGDPLAVGMVDVVGEDCRQSILVPRHWEALAIRAVFHDGSRSDIIEIPNQFPSLGLTVSPVNSDADAPELNLAPIYIEPRGDRSLMVDSGQPLIHHFVTTPPGLFKVYRVDNELDEEVSEPFLLGNENSVKLLLRGGEGLELGPYEFRLPAEERNRLILASCLPLLREKHNLVVAYRCKTPLPKPSKVFSGVGRKDSIVTPEMFSHSDAYRKTDGVGIYVVGPASNWLWRGVKEVRLGVNSGQPNDITIPITNEYGSGLLGDGVMAFFYRFGLDTTVFAQLVLIDGTELPSFELIADSLH